MAKPRSGFSKFLTYGVLGLAALAMAGFGITGIFTQATSGTVATVGDSSVSTDEYFLGIQNEISRTSQQFGQSISIDQALLFGLDRTVLQRLIQQAAFRGEGERLGISVSDQTVADSLLGNPGFQGLDGTFDEEIYEESVRRSGLSPSEYEDLLRNSATQEIILQSLVAGANIPAEANLAIFEYLGESRGFNYLRLDESNMNGVLATPTDSDLTEYFAANPTEFTQALTRKITYVSMTPANLADSIEISDDEITALYEERSDEYNTPEKRFVERIVLGDLEEANDAVTQIVAGDLTFEGLAEQRGLALAAIDLGDVTRRDLSSAAAELLFATEEPGIYGPAISDLGPAIYRVNASIAAQTIPLEDVRDELKNELAIEEAINVIGDEVDGIIDLIAGGASLEDLADETKMQLDAIDWIEGTSDDIAAYPVFREEATASEIGEERDIVEMNDGGIFVLRLDEIIEPFVKPFDEVSDDVNAAWLVQKTNEKIAARGEQIVSAIKASNGSLVDFANNLNVEFAGEIARTSNIPDLPPAIITQIYDLAVGDTAIVEDINGVVVVELESITPFDPADEDSIAVLEQIEAQRAEQVGLDVTVYFGQALVNQGQPTINQPRIDSLHLQLQ